TVPASVSVPANASTASFTATAGSITTAATAIVTATLNGVSVTDSIALQAPASGPTVTGIQCTPASVASGTSTSCLVSLSAAAPSGGTGFARSDNSSMLTVPAPVAVPASFPGAPFTATGGTITTAGNATVTATANGSSVTFSIALQTATPALTGLACNSTTLT